MKTILFAFVAILLLFTACKDKYYYSEYQSIKNQSWLIKDTLTFSKTIEQPSNTPHQILLSVRHDKDFEFSNLWLQVDVSYNGKTASKKQEVVLYNKLGKPFGKCTGSICTQTIPIVNNISFDKKGIVQIKITQLMRKNPIENIKDIGVIIE
ncbi:MAG: gliding motility lipoprotein GldH [Chitinophagales bacterium]